jgi:hypothetical protein
VYTLINTSLLDTYQLECGGHYLLMLKPSGNDLKANWAFCPWNKSRNISIRTTSIWTSLILGTEGLSSFGAYIREKSTVQVLPNFPLFNARQNKYFIHV